MALPAITWPLAPWARVLVWFGIQSAVELIEQFFDAGDSVAGPEDMAWRRVSVRWGRDVPAGFREDQAQIGFDLMKFDGSNVQGSWVAADFVAAEARITTFLNAMSSLTPAYYVRQEMRWHFMRFRPMTDAKPFVNPGPAVRVTPISGVGTGAATSPAQMAMTITERTPVRKNWGRFYFPIASGALELASPRRGRFTPAALAAAANAIQACYAGLVADGFAPVVPITSVQKIPTRALLPVTQVVVDDVPDVVRRRRYKQAVLREIRP